MEKELRLRKKVGEFVDVSAINKVFNSSREKRIRIFSGIMGKRFRWNILRLQMML